MNDDDSDRTEIAFGSTRVELIGFALLYLLGGLFAAVWWTAKNRPEMSGSAYDKFLEAAVQLVLGWPVLFVLGLVMAFVGYAYIMERRLEELEELED